MRNMLNRLFYGLLCGGMAAILSACNLAAFQPAPTPTPELPSVEFIFPSNGSTVIEGAPLEIDIVARDALSGIAKIELLVEGEKVSQAAPTEAITVPVFRVTMNWLARGVGYHALSAVAYRLDGVASAEKIIIVEVLPKESR